MTQRIFKIAHRGASGYAPENTLAAFDKALGIGADMIEMDVRRTKDGELVVFHDSRISRVTNGRGSLKHLTYDELCSYDISGHNIPTLNEALLRVRGFCQVNIEIKERGLAEDVARIVKHHGMQQETLVSSFIHSELVIIKALDRNFRIAILLNSTPSSAKIAVKLALGIGAEALNVPLKVCSTRLVKIARREGIKINIWTVDEHEDILWLKEIGVDGIISNFPDRI